MRFKNTYVIAPKNYATGGVELAHQLVHILREKGQNAYISYVENGVISDDQSVTIAYAGYNIATTDNIEDSDDNMIILPEVFMDYAYHYNKASIGMWWMSVDNHFHACHRNDSFKFPGSFSKRMKLFIQHRNSPFKNKLADFKNSDRFIHFYQSHYAQHFLYSNGFSNLYPLSDYINVTFIKPINTISKKDIVLYNPAQGYRFTKKIIAANPDIDFIAIKGMTREEVAQHMSDAKLYIDFGNFPGKDRLPREAALNGCCIISGKNGASFFFEDLPIPSAFKFETKRKNIVKISAMIKKVLTNYNELQQQFLDYRNIIMKEEYILKQEIDSFFD